MHYLYCTKGGIHKRVVGVPAGSYPVLPNSTLGKAMQKTNPGDYVTVDSIERFKGHRNGPFSHLSGIDLAIHPVLNVGKDWIFRTFFTTGSEMIGADTGSTMQSFQTKLKRSTDDEGCFHVMTLVTGCKNGQLVALEVKHHFVIKPDDGGDEIITEVDAAKDVEEDFKKIMANAGNAFISVPRVDADDFYAGSTIEANASGSIDRGSTIVSSFFN